MGAVFRSRDNKAVAKRVRHGVVERLSLAVDRYLA